MHNSSKSYFNQMITGHVPGYILQLLFENLWVWIPVCSEILIPWDTQSTRASIKVLDHNQTSHEMHCACVYVWKVNHAGSDLEVCQGEVAPLCHKVRDAKHAPVSGAVPVICTQLSSWRSANVKHRERDSLSPSSIISSVFMCRSWFYLISSWKFTC